MAFYECKDTEAPRVIITCDCVGECSEIHIIKNTEEVEGKHGPEEQTKFYVSIQPKANIKFSFWHRLKHAWKVLTTGGLYEDNVTLKFFTAIDLAEWILRTTNPSLTEMKEYEKKRQE